MTHTTTVIFTSTKTDAAWAIDYRRFHHQEKVKIFPIDIPALLYLLKTSPRSINRIDSFVKLSPRLQSSVTAPLKIAQQLISTHPHLKLWIDVFRSQLVKALSHYYILRQIAQKTHCRKIITGSSSFYLPAVRQFAQDYHLTFQVIPPPAPTSFLSQLQHRLFLYLEPIRWFLAHPQELPSFLFNFLPSSSSSRAQVLIFSNGLNLASYHSAIKALARLVSVKIVTDQQNFKDRLYLAKYGITGQQLRVPASLHPPKITTKITLAAIKSAPWFITPNSLRGLCQGIISQTISVSGAKILAKKQQAQNLIAQSQPKLVITTHDPGPSGLSFVAAAQAQKIKTLVLLHGAPSHIHYFYSDSQLIWGKLMQRWLIKAGISQRRLKLGGYPIYADYHKYFNSYKPKPNTPTIGIITTGDGQYEWHQTLYFWDLFQALRAFRQYRIMVRTHGMQHLQPVAQLARYFGIKLSLNPPLHLEEFIAQSDLIITQNSTAALVPLIAHKPTVLLDSWFPFLDEGLIKDSPAFLKVKNFATLPRLINHLIAGRTKTSLRVIQDKFISQFCGSLDTQIGKNLAQQIKRLI